MNLTLQVNKIAQLTGHKSGIYIIRPGLNDNEIITAGGDGWIVTWDLDQAQDGQLIAKTDHQLFSLCPMLDRQQLVAGDMNGGVHWIDLNNSENTKGVAHHKKGVFAIHRIDDVIYTLGGDGILSKWDINSRRATDSIRLSYKSLRCLAYDPVSENLAIGSSDQTIYILNAKTLAIVKVISEAHDNSIFCLQYLPDGHHIISGGRDAHLKVWDLQHGQEKVFDEAAHLFTINSISAQPSGKYFATGSRDKSVKIWDATNFKLLKVLESPRDHGHVNSVNHLLWTNHKNYLLSCSDDRSIIIWEVK